MRLVWRAVAALALLAPSVHAEGSAVDACVADADAGQVLRDASKLIDARSAFRRCASAACPAPIRSDCTSWATEVDARVPILRLRTVDGHGRPVAATTTLDGRVVTGDALEVDPGPHVVEASIGRERRTRSVMLGPGDRSGVELAFASGGVAPVTLVALGVAGVSLGLGTFFAFKARSSYDDLDARCAPTCAGDDVSSVRREGLLADVFFATGLVALGVAAYAYLRQDHP